ncbi:MAG: hypothetical protein QM723_08780 [Myxococcaceae bacterium]
MNLKRMTLKELKLLAGQKLGELAARLKTKADLISALEKLVPASSPPVPAQPKLVPVERAAVKAAPPPAPKYGAPKAPVASPPAVRPTVVPKKVARPAAAAAPVSMPKVTRPLEVAEKPSPVSAPLPARPSLTVTQDFFVMPGTARLPSAHADDRVLAFPRDTGGIYVSWDFSERTWGSGPATLEVVEGDEVLSSHPVDAPWGGRFIDVSAAGAVFVEVRRGPMLLGRSPFLSLPPVRGQKVERKRLSVRWSEPLPARGHAVPSNRPYTALTKVRIERIEASSDVRRIEEEELGWDVSSSQMGVTSRMA